ncbi:Coenzyme F420 hydrogenase/dehydrogenase, beta subunit C-terminal domain [Planctomycetota bacterium]
MLEVDSKKKIVCARNPKPDISCVVAEHLCLSCGACFAVCNHGSISYIETVGGYLFPKINTETCTHCGLCYEVCPGVHFGKTLNDRIPEDPFVGDIISCHVGKAVNKRIFQNSQSGGVATALLAYLLTTGQISAAIVASMKDATPPRGEVVLAKNIDDLMAAQKAKYVPIPLLSAISRIRKADGPVAFVGLGCHMHGLNNLFDLYPKLKPKVLIKIGLICDRVLTNAAVDFLGRKATSQPIKHLTFRDKQRPSYPGNVVVESETGEQTVLDASLRMLIKDFFTPVRCRLCFDKLNVYADVVLGDPHGLKGIDRKRGETLVFTRTRQGKELVSAVVATGSIVIRPEDKQAAIKGQGIDKKRLRWSSYMQAWSMQDRSIPAYYETVLKSVGAQKVSPQKYKADLLYSIGLDSFASRSAVLNSVNRLLLKRSIAESLQKLYFKIRKIVNQVKKTIRRICK